MLCLSTGFFKAASTLQEFNDRDYVCELIYLTHFWDSEESKLSQDLVRQLSNMNL